MTVDALRRLPKVELHAHLNGCIGATTVTELIHEFGLDIPPAFRLPDDLQIVTLVRGFPEYFRPWQILKQLPPSRDCLERILTAVASEFDADGVRYAELRYSPSNIVRGCNVSLPVALAWLIEATHLANSSATATLRIVVSLNREESTPEYCDALVAHLRSAAASEYVVGVDLTGDEDKPVGKHTARYFRRAADELGLPCAIHAGETGRPSHVRWAIDDCKARRIGHGLGAIHDPSVLDAIRDADICIEACLTANQRTGFVEDLTLHPIHRFLDHASRAVNDRWQSVHQTQSIPSLPPPSSTM